MQRFQGYTRLNGTALPAPGATVTVYSPSGSLTLADIYSDVSGTPKANPFTSTGAGANSGYFYFYAAPGTYDVRISGTGITTPYTWGDISIGADDTVSVLTYGAVGDDSHDDTVAIQAAIDSLPTSGNYGGTVYFPPGIYKITAPIVTHAGIKLLGAGNLSSIVNQYSNTDGIQATAGDDGQNIVVQDLQVFDKINSTRTVGHAFNFTVTDARLVMERNYVVGFIDGFHATSCRYSNFNNNRVTGMLRDGFSIAGSGNNDDVFINNQVNGANLVTSNPGGRYGYFLTNMNYTEMVGNFADSCANHALYVVGGILLKVNSFSAEACTGDGIRCETIDHVNLSVINVSGHSGNFPINGIALDQCRGFRGDNLYIQSPSAYGIKLIGNCAGGLIMNDQISGAGTADFDLGGNILNRFGGGFASTWDFISPKEYTFATVPSAVTYIGRMIVISDSNTAVWGAIIAGGGGNRVLAFSNGTNWTVAGK